MPVDSLPQNSSGSTLPHAFLERGIAMVAFTPTCLAAVLIVLTLIAGGSLVATLALPITPLLPAEGQSVCFSSAFADGKELRFGWGDKVDEGPAPMRAMRVLIQRPPPPEPPEPGSSFYGQPVHGFGFTLLATVTAEILGKGSFRAPTQCGGSDGWLSRIDPELGCWIDCDGGGITIARVPGRGAVTVTWGKSWHLRMSSCGGGGAYLRAPGEALSFRLEPAPAERCGELSHAKSTRVLSPADAR